MAPTVNSSFVITTEALDTLAADDRAGGRCRITVHQVARLVVVRGPVGIRDKVTNLVRHRPAHAWDLALVATETVDYSSAKIGDGVRNLAGLLRLDGPGEVDLQVRRGGVAVGPQFVPLLVVHDVDFLWQLDRQPNSVPQLPSHSTFTF